MKPINTNAPLTTSESQLFKKHESVIKAGKNTFVLVGMALTEIRDGRLYRQEFFTFEEYCDKRWGWTHGRADQLIRAAAVVQALPLRLDTMVSNEGQARELAKVPESKRVEVIKAAAKNGTVTARSIKESAKPIIDAVVVSPKPKGFNSDVKDKTGRLIPNKILELWNHAEAEAKESMASVAKALSAFRRGQENKDRVYCEIEFQENIGMLSSVKGDLARVAPWAVCTACQGAVPEKCTLCRGRGFISKFLFDTCVDDKTKAIRAKTSE